MPGSAGWLDSACESCILAIRSCILRRPGGHMFKPTLDLIAGQYSGERAKRHVEELARFHRIQASPGLRAAAAYCLRPLPQPGADGRDRALCRRRQDALLVGADAPGMGVQRGAAASGLLRPAQAAPAGRLCRAQARRSSSAASPTPPEGIEAEVVVLDRRARMRRTTHGLDVAGKLVLTKGNLRRVHDLAVQRRGARRHHLRRHARAAAGAPAL